ncbi:MAG: TM2 domain-containing protein [Ruminococcaceae bacterium]|nr:TM2 domain-containing protein [Oscillospiraceae bacterium]
MYCKNCGQQMNDNQAICLACGVEKGKGNAYCSNCGAALAPNASVCMNCGVATAQPKDRLNGQDKILMAVLCFFLGSIGIHNFVMGETKKGIVKIVASFICGISTILMLIDFVKILTDKYTYDPNALF